MTDKLPALPDPLERILQRTLNASALSGHARNRVRRELHAYFEDALSAGVSISEIVAEFGDPESSGALIKRSPPRRESVHASLLRAVQLAAALTTVLFVSVYGATAVRFRSFAQESAALSPWLDSIANVAALASVARASLRYAGPASATERMRLIGLAVDTARQAASRSDPFSRLVSARVTRVIVDAAVEALRDPALTTDHRRVLGAHLAALASITARPVEPREILDWFDQLVQRSFDTDGRLNEAGLRVAQAMKGTRQPSLGARALEPIFFVRADDARGARESARRVFSREQKQTHRGELWSAMVVQHINAGLEAQAVVASQLPQLIELTHR